MSRRVCLALGVSAVTPEDGAGQRFAYLDGALVAAEMMGQWALGSGFGADNVRVVTDRVSSEGQPQPVTVAKVQEAVNALFPPGAEPVEHMILSFCGHGLTDAQVESAFWLFSDSLIEGYRVNVNMFARELLTYGVQRISLVSDACRDAPQDLDLLRLDSRRAIRGRTSGQVNSPKFDRLAACQDGQRAYMVGAPFSAEPGKCILSGVVLDVLWGQEPDAFQNDVIDTIRFGAFVRMRATQRALEYRLKLFPQTQVDPEAAPLVDRNRPVPAPDPELAPWPLSSVAAAMGPAQAEEASQAIERLNTDLAFRERTLGADFGRSHPNLDLSMKFVGLPGNARNLVSELIALQSLEPVSWAEIQIKSTLRALEGRAAKHAATAASGHLRKNLSRLVLPGQASAVNLIVTGGSVRALWSEQDPEWIRRADRRRQFAVPLAGGSLGAQVVIEFADGLCAPVYLYPDLYTVVARRQGGIGAVAYGKAGDDVLFASSSSVVTRLSGGMLGTADEVAALIRPGKHANPVLGVIAAHLYRAVLDFDNIRRLAYYYVENGQPVPFDIALLGEMPVESDGQGGYQVRIPEVAGRPESRASSALPDFTRRATPARIGKLAGRCPWLTVGWDYPPENDFADRRYVSALQRLSRPSGFTFLSDAHAVLAQDWRLLRREF